MILKGVRRRRGIFLTIPPRRVGPQAARTPAASYAAKGVLEDRHNAIDEAALAQTWVLPREHEVDQFLDVTHRHLASPWHLLYGLWAGTGARPRM